MRNYFVDILGRLIPIAIFVTVAVLFVVPGYGKGTSVKGSSLVRFVEKVAVGLEERASEAGFTGRIRLIAKVGNGLKPRAVDKYFRARLNERLNRGGLIKPVKQATASIRLTLSLERGSLWLVGELNEVSPGGGIPIVVTSKMDRELETYLGIPDGNGLRRGWRFERAGELPDGVLDLFTM